MKPRDTAARDISARQLAGRRRHAALFLALIAASFLVATLLGFTAYGKQMNEDAYDRFLRVRGPAMGAPDRTVVVAIDEATLHAQGQWPFRRSVQARAIATICAAQPAAVGIDILYSEAGPDDAALVETLKTCPHLVLAVAPVPAADGVQWIAPVAPVAASAAGLGHVEPDADDDGVHRAVQLEKVAAGKRYWLLAFECFRLMSPATLVEDDDALQYGALRIPAARRNHRALLINFGPPVRHISFEDLLEGKTAPADFAGKAVLLGHTAGGLTDRQITPFSTEGVTMPGVDIHAQVLEMLLGGHFLSRWPESSTFLAQLAISAAVGAALFYLRGLWLAAVCAALGIAVHASPYFLLLHGDAAPAFSLALPFWVPLIAGGGFQYWTTWRRFVTADATSQRLRRQMDFVTHEVRSPLTAIAGSGELMARYPMDEKRRKQLSELFVRESQRMARMFSRFYDVERLLTGEIELRRDPVELGGVVEAAVEHVRPFAERKQIELQVSIESPGPAEGDAELLEFAVYNLMSNAVKYSPERSVVKITAASARGRASIEVRDQGPGISREDTAKIFERFYRTDDAAASDKPGYGLGLMFVREIARHHGGEVTVASKAGEGSAFKLIVPNSENGK